MKQQMTNDRTPILVAAITDIAPDVSWGQNVFIKALQVTIGAGTVIGDNVRIEGSKITIGKEAQIQDNVSISASHFSLGYRSRVEERCQISGMGKSNADKVVIGDVSLLAADCRVFIPILLVGDYVKIHNHTLINGRKVCIIGHNSWIGQNNILNAEDTLTIGNHVGLGIYTSVWTHAYYGDLLEGCNTFKIAPTTIGNDVWVIGAYNAIAPGINIGDKAMVMSHSLVAKDVSPNHCVAGIPARDITDKITPYRLVSLEEKFEMIHGFILEYLNIRYADSFTIKPTGFYVKNDTHQFEIIFMDFADDRQIGEDSNKIIITKRSNVTRDLRHVTIFDLDRREYTKRLTDPEIEIISFLLSYRARFTPVGNTTVEL